MPFSLKCTDSGREVFFCKSIFVFNPLFWNLLYGFENIFLWHALSFHSGHDFSNDSFHHLLFLFRVQHVRFKMERYFNAYFSFYNNKKVNLETFSLQIMEREQAVSVAKKVSYLLIISGVAMISATIVYFSTVPISWISYVGIIVGGLMLGFGSMVIRFIKKLKLDIKSSD